MDPILCRCALLIDGRFELAQRLIGDLENTAGNTSLETISQEGFDVLRYSMGLMDLPVAFWVPAFFTSEVYSRIAV